MKKSRTSKCRSGGRVLVSSCSFRRNRSFPSFISAEVSHDPKFVDSRAGSGNSCTTKPSGSRTLNAFAKPHYRCQFSERRFGGPAQFLFQLLALDGGPGRLSRRLVSGFHCRSPVPERRKLSLHSRHCVALDWVAEDRAALRSHIARPDVYLLRRFAVIRLEDAGYWKNIMPDGAPIVGLAHPPKPSEMVIYAGRTSGQGPAAVARIGMVSLLGTLRDAIRIESYSKPGDGGPCSTPSTA